MIGRKNDIEIFFVFTILNNDDFQLICQINSRWCRANALYFHDKQYGCGL